MACDLTREPPINALVERDDPPISEAVPRGYIESRVVNDAMLLAGVDEADAAALVLEIEFLPTAIVTLMLMDGRG